MISLVIEVLKDIKSTYCEPLLIYSYQNEELATFARFLKQKGFIELFSAV